MTLNHFLYVDSWLSKTASTGLFQMYFIHGFEGGARQGGSFPWLISPTSITTPMECQEKKKLILDVNCTNWLTVLL